jgi:hypothetical protein
LAADVVGFSRLAEADAIRRFRNGNEGATDLLNATGKAGVPEG